MPRAQLQLVERTLLFSRIVALSEVNKMTFSNIGTSVGIQVFPGITSNNTATILEFMASHTDAIFAGHH